MPTPQSLAGTSPLEDLVETGSLIFEGGSRPRLAIPKVSVAKLWSQVQDGVRIVPHGGIEVGGLLVGPKSRESGIVVDTIVPLAIKYEYGPSFRMSASDLASVVGIVESVQADPCKTVLGLYRSRTRGSENLRESDREIFAAIEQAHMSFAADFRCFFVVTPISKSEMSACIAIRDGENWDPVPFTLRSDPFSVVPAQPPPESRHESGPPTEHLTKPSVVSVIQDVQPLAHEHDEASATAKPLHRSASNSSNGTSRPSKGFYALSGLLLLLVATGIYLRSRPAQFTIGSVRQPLHIGFTANREGLLWKLSWDRSAMERMAPSSAVLTITDRDSSHQLKLTPADLSNGTILYTPHGGDLVFSLQLDHGATPIEEHIRVVEDLPSVQKSAQGETEAQPKSTVPQANASTRSNFPTKRPRAASSRNERGKTVRQVMGQSIRASFPVAETPVELASEPSSAVPEQTKPNNNDAVSVASIARAGSEQPAGPTTNLSVLPPPPPAGTGTSASLHPGESPPPARSVYVGPVPVQKVPAQPPQGRDFRGIVIRVRMAIDARGKVTKATAIEVTPANSPLVSSAERAALSWQFEPATINGRPVPSQLDLLLRF